MPGVGSGGVVVSVVIVWKLFKCDCAHSARYMVTSTGVGMVAPALR
jgi:hypothetical protein